MFPGFKDTYYFRSVGFGKVTVKYIFKSSTFDFLFKSVDACRYTTVYLTPYFCVATLTVDQDSVKIEQKTNMIVHFHVFQAPGVGKTMQR